MAYGPRRALISAALALAALAGCGPTPGQAPTPAAGGVGAPPATQSPTPPPPSPSSRPPSPTPPPPSPTPPPPSPTPPSPSPTPPPSPTPVAAPVRYSYPIGWPGQPLGAGFSIRHGAGAENTWYSPGNWHTGEDWYALEGDTAGAGVYAVAAGAVVYAGANYPGRVVIVRHADGLFSMYGHLDPGLRVAAGDEVGRGQLIGTVLARDDGRAPSHLHFEIRTFLEAREVNGAAPRYSFRCGVSCPPGPGYWPIAAPELPGALGWLNPTHVIARRMADPAAGRLGAVVAATPSVSPSLALWSAPPDDPARRQIGALALRGGERLTLLAVWAGPEELGATSALAYELWYQVALADGTAGWAQAAIPVGLETGADGRPSSVALALLPDVAAGGLEARGRRTAARGRV